MPISEVLTDLLVAIGLAIAVAGLLWPLRSSGLARRAVASVWLALLVSWADDTAQLLGVPLLLSQLIDLTADQQALLLDVLDAARILLWVNAVLQLADVVIWELVLGRGERRTVPRLVMNVVNVLVLMLAFLGVLNAVFEVQITTLLVTSTVASAVIGLSLQDVLRNVIAGIALQVESPFSLGDWVTIGGHQGQVRQMNWRTVTLRTRDNHFVVLTNVQVANQELVNYTRPRTLQAVEDQVGVAYAHPPGAVKQVLVQAMLEAPDVRPSPTPRVQVIAYGDFAIHYRLRYWITDFGRLPDIKDAVMSRVWYRLRRADMTIPFPVRDVTVSTRPEDHAARQQAAQERTIVGCLRPLPLLGPLSDEQIAQVAAGSTLQRYTTGEHLVRQGEPGDSLYVVRSGRVRVDVRGEANSTHTVAQRGPGDFFGEMSLLTGEPRSASVIAESEVEAVVVDRAAFAEVIASDPTIAEQLSDVLVRRSQELEEYRVRGGEGAAAKERSLQAAVLGRIRRFFSAELSASVED